MVREIRMKFGDSDGTVRQLSRMIEKESFILVFANVVQNTFDENVLRIGFAAIANRLIAFWLANRMSSLA